MAARKRLLQLAASFNFMPQQIRLWTTLLSAQRLGLVRSPFRLFNPKPVALKHLGEYVSTSFSTSDRLEILDYTYRYLVAAKMRSIDLRLRVRSLIWSAVIDGIELAIWIGPATLAPMEGEAALCFTFNDRTLFTLSFSIAPGRIIGADSDCIVIGGLQGGLECRLESREACKKLHEISPQDVLVIASRALAQFLNIDLLAGISCRQHVARITSGTKWNFDYDQFWERLGATQTDQGLFLFSPEAGTSAADASDRTQRARARRKRRLRVELQGQISRSLVARFRACPSTGRGLLRSGIALRNAPARG